MDGTKFSEAYQFPATGRFHPDEEKQALFEDAHKWSDTFSELTHDLLRGKEPGAETSKNLIQSYMQWYIEEFPALLESSSDTEDRYDSQNREKLNFHLLNSAMIGLWAHILIFERKTMSPQLIRTVQNNLASNAIDMMGDRQDSLDRRDFYSEENTQSRLHHLGMLNEYDTAIVTQEISMRHQQIVVLPSPSQFESSTDSSKNSDFLAIDLRDMDGERQVRGIQAKLSVSQATAEAYDKDYVTLVDGVVDLGSTKSYRPKANSSDTVTRTWPGLIAAHHLLSTKSVDVIPNVAKRNIRISGNKQLTAHVMQLNVEAQRRKFEAKKHADATKSNNKKAAQIVVERVMADLYK